MFLTRLFYKRYFESFFRFLELLRNSGEPCSLTCSAKSPGQHWVHSGHVRHLPYACPTPVLHLSPKHVLGDISTQPFQRWHEERYVVVAVLHKPRSKRRRLPEDTLSAKPGLRRGESDPQSQPHSFTTHAGLSYYSRPLTAAPPEFFLVILVFLKLPRQCRLITYKVTD